MNCKICDKPLTDNQVWRIKNRSQHDYGFCSRECSGIYSRGKKKAMSKSNEQRFMEKVNKTDTCWEWIGAKIPKGYGRFGYYKEEKGHVTCYAHRFAYELFIGDIPEGMTIDHLCKNTSCVNPEHLEVVSSYENLMRSDSPSSLAAKRTHCVNGHPFDEENTRRWKNKRICKTCDRINHRNKKNKNTQNLAK
jgi:hypothetical protein